MWLLDRVKPDRKFEIEVRDRDSMPQVGELAREDKVGVKELVFSSNKKRGLNHSLTVMNRTPLHNIKDNCWYLRQSLSIEIILAPHLIAATVGDLDKFDLGLGHKPFFLV